MGLLEGISETKPCWPTHWPRLTLGRSTAANISVRGGQRDLKMVPADSLGDAPVETDRLEECKGGGRTDDRRSLHCTWVDGTSFEWGNEKMA